MSSWHRIVEEVSRLKGPRHRDDYWYSLYRLCLGLHEGRPCAAKQELLKYLEGNHSQELFEYCRKLVHEEHGGY